MLLIDGNNVIGQRVGWHRDKAGARRRLLTELARAGKAGSGRYAVVFDGAPDPGFPDGSRFEGVKVYYARSGSDADHRILELIEGMRDRQGLIVVTSDRGLTAKVRVSGIKVMKSGVFRRQLEDWLADHASTEDQPDDRGLSEWMRYFGVSEEDD
jgi:predicted RNA-binding protein with PIN domain